MSRRAVHHDYGGAAINNYDDGCSHYYGDGCADNHGRPCDNNDSGEHDDYVYEHCTVHDHNITRHHDHATTS